LIRRIFSPYRSFNREVWFLVVISFLTRTITFLLLPFMLVYLGNIGMSTAEIGWIVGMSWILGAFAGPLIGFLSDRFGYRKLYFILMILWTISFFGFTISTNFVVLLIASLVNGFGRCCIDVVLLARMFPQVAENERTSVSNLNFIAFNAGGMIGPFIGVELSKYFSSEVFIGSGCFFLILMLLDPFFRCKEKNEPAEQRITFHETMKVLWKDSKLKWYIITGTIFGVAYIQIDFLLPIALQSGQLFDWYSPLSLVNAIVAVALTAPVIHWAEKKSLSSMILLSIVLTAFGFFCFMANSLPFYFIGVFLISLGEVIFYPLWREAVASLNRPMQGTYLGTTSFTCIGFTIGSAFGGEIYKDWGNIWVFLFFGLFSFIAYFAFIYGQFAVRRQREKNYSAYGQGVK
jgi:MFS family permease